MLDADLLRGDPCRVAFGAIPDCPSEPVGLAAPIAGSRARPLFSSDERRSQAESLWRSGASFSLLYVEIDNFSIFSSLYGYDIAEQILRSLAGELAALNAERLPGCGFVLSERLDRGRFFTLCVQDCLPAELLPDTAMTYRLRLRGVLKQETLRLTGRAVDVLTGYAILGCGAAISFEDALYGALCDAQQVAKGALDLAKLTLLKEFREIVKTPLLTPVYQPIVDLASGATFGWEALIRGPEKSHFRPPSVLFDFAEEMESVFSLERACRETCIAGLGGGLGERKLFLNIHPRTIVDPGFSPGATKKFLAEHGLEPRNVVFEITERHSIRDFTLFNRTIEHYRSQGYLVAVDDVGAGYSGLQSIAEIRPDYIKIDMSLVRGIDVNPVKRALLETFVAFADKIGCRVIAEGIETETEMSSLVSMGVHYGQGFCLCRPANPRPNVDPALSARISAHSRRASEEWKCSMPLRDLAEPAFVVEPRTPVSEVKRLLEAHEPISAVVVAADDKPIGLIMSHHLDRALSTPYGMSLYFHKSVSRLMDGSALIEDGGSAVENVAKRAMSREKYKIYDHVIVTEGGRMRGIVSVQKMLDALACVQVEMAKGANPLTGLPGNIHIEQELERRARGGEPTSFVYVDLDNFKAYNDAYGFKNGDNIILLIARILAWAIRKRGLKDDFIGHVGGDDFVVMTRPERAERLCRSVARCFGRAVRSCYNREDVRRGHIKGKDRATGAERDFPLVSVSMAIVDCVGPCDPYEVARRSAEMKKYVKAIAGNAWARDRRAPLGPGPDR